MSFVIIFWLLLFVLGWLTFPISFSLFDSLKDRGYSFVKILSLALSAYIVWLLVSLKIFSYSRLLILFSFFLTSLFSLGFFIKNHQKLSSFLKKNWPIIFFEEILFLALLLLGVMIRILNPAVLRHALVSENLMNLSFINSLNVAQSFPPQDVWMSGYSLNYYYFGPLLASIITKFLNLSINSFLGVWNIGLFALAGLGAFGIIFNLTKKLGWGLTGTLFLSLASRLDLLNALLTKTPLSQYYFNNNRLSDSIVNEFPFYELTNHNPHSQVISTLFILLALGLILQLMRDRFKKNWSIIALGFALGFILFTHAWDYPAIFCISLIALLLTSPQKCLSKIFFLLTTPFLSLSLFLVRFQRPISRIIFRSASPPFSKIFLVFGLFLFPISLFIFQHFFPFSLRKLTLEKKFILLCILFGLFLVVIPNFFYIHDCWGSPFNTFYKFYYQAWALLSLGAAGASFFLWGKPKSSPWKTASNFLLLAFLLLSLFSLGSSVLAVYQRIEEGEGINRLDLDSFSYFQRWDKDEAQALEWVQKNIPPGSVILENGLGDYWLFARISALSGRPTVLGWPFHETCWRGNLEEISQRSKDIETIFTSLDLDLVKSLLEKYHVEYIYLGNKEKEKYPLNQLEKLSQISKPVFKNTSVTIFSRMKIHTL